MGRLAGVLAALGLLLGTAGIASAADPAANIDHVEVSDDGTSIAVVLGLPAGVTPDPDSVLVSVDGSAAVATTKTVATGDVLRTVVLALDASNSMRGGKFEAAKQAALAYLASAPSDVRIGLVTFADKVSIVADPTTDHRVLKASLDQVTLTRGTLLYDGVATAAQLTGDRGVRSVLLLSDGKDTGSTRSLESVITDAQDVEAIVDVVALDQEPTQQELIDQLATSTGGDVVAADPASLAATFQAQARALATQLLVTFPRPAGVGDEADLEVSVADTAGVTYQDSAVITLPGVVKEAAPRVSKGSWAGEPVLFAGALALALGLAGIIWVAASGAVSGTSLAQRQIEHYTDANRRGWGLPEAGVKQPAAQSLRSSAVSATEKLLRGDFESRLATKLSGAGLQWTSAEWLLLHTGIAVAAAFVGLVLRGPMLMLLMLLLGIVLPWLYLSRKHSQRLANFDAQLPETLQLISGGLSAGLSLPQAVDTVVREGAEPMSGELRRALVEQRLGVDIADSLESVAARMNSTDFDWVVMAIRIQREVGGNLAELLNTVASTMREREYLRRQVRVLSAEGRISALVLGALPILMAIYLAIFRPDFLSPMFHSFLGISLLTIAVVLLLTGFFVLSRLVKIEV